MSDLRLPILLWWLDKPACDLAQILGAGDALWPAYIKEEFAKRARWIRGYGQLLVPEELSYFVPKEGFWEKDSEPYKTIASVCDAIVIRRYHAQDILPWPGFVTDVDLIPIQFARRRRVDVR